jgi:cytochrome c
MIAIAAACIALSSVSLTPPPATKAFLVFSKTTGFRHDAIPDGIVAITDIAKERKWTVEFSEDSSVFEPKNLARFNAVVFLMTTGDILDPDQKKAMQAFVEGGGGYVGIHSASDTEYKWDWYGMLVGAWFNGHPAQQEAKIHIENKKHPSTSFLPDPWVRKDEWYNFKTNPRANVTVLATVDETTYQGGTMNGDHPIIWCHNVGKGRSWYTAIGHTKESYKDPLFLRMLAEGLNWVVRGRPGK